MIGQLCVCALRTSEDVITCAVEKQKLACYGCKATGCWLGRLPEDGPCNWLAAGHHAKQHADACPDLNA